MRQPIDIAIRLRDARLRKGLSQKQAAKLSGVGEKTISTFESGWRTDSMKVSQLRALLYVYGVTEARFWSQDYTEDSAAIEVTPAEMNIIAGLRNLSPARASEMLDNISLALRRALASEKRAA